MAELLIAKGWTPPDPLALDLEENLPERWTVVVGPTVWGCTLDAVVVTAQGLAVLHAREWAGTIHPAAQGDWHATQPDGATQTLPNPAEAVRAAARALIKYLADEFPTLHPPIAHLVVLTGAATPDPEPAAAYPPVVPAAELATAIADALPAAEDPTLSADAQAMLARMLWLRRLTRHQHSATPFIFRSGATARSIAEIAVQADKVPGDGVYHLRNGTLARWFDEQGAADLATVARDVLRAFPLDTRAALEVLLQETGVVERPTLSVYPPRLDLGAVVAGSERMASFRVQQRGRGYLFGTLYTDTPWLHLETHTFAGADTTVLVRADARELPISARPLQGIIHLTSPVIVAPVDVPVRLHVTAAPSVAQRRVVTPLLWGVTTGALGVLAAVVLGVLAAWPPVSSRWPAVALVGVLWALAGLRMATPRPRALLQWLARLVAWTTVLAGAVALLLWLWTTLGAAVPAWTAALPFVAGACGALVALSAGRATDDATTPPPLPRERAMVWGRRTATGVAVALVAALLIAGWQQAGVQQARQEVQAWLVARLGEADAQLGTWSSDLQVRYYDRRAAPSAPSGVLPTVTPTPAAAGQGG